MSTLTEAISVFQQNPTDESAQDINLAAMTESAVAFVQSGDGISIDSELFTALDSARQALESTASPSHLIKHYAKSMNLRIKLLQAKQLGNSTLVKQLLRDALQQN
ncbi:hypothetical protein A2706_02275 [Candidatus Peribacteria bacterium RIFCSPHIGHO2_01_FULL_51_35]|nr:MAG: hypothetical protein A2706_02275 [Candidatus Peribacteria bacterium RIFCSPHIGHO2_01_FULL_51_35]